jgi:hypothetical protein
MRLSFWNAWRIFLASKHGQHTNNTQEQSLLLMSRFMADRTQAIGSRRTLN